MYTVAALHYHGPGLLSACSSLLKYSVGFYLHELAYTIHMDYHMRENFRWIKISPSPATFVLQKNFVEKMFRQCGNSRHVLYAIFHTEQHMHLN